MAGLRNYQFEISLNTIYEIKSFDDLFKYLSPRIFVDGGSVDFYVSEEIPSSKANMYLQNPGISGTNYFSSIPNYIYVEESAPTVSKVILSGVKPFTV